MREPSSVRLRQSIRMRIFFQAFSENSINKQCLYCLIAQLFASNSQHQVPPPNSAKFCPVSLPISSCLFCASLSELGNMDVLFLSSILCQSYIWIANLSVSRVHPHSCLYILGFTWLLK